MLVKAEDCLLLSQHTKETKFVGPGVNIYTAMSENFQRCSITVHPAGVCSGYHWQIINFHLKLSGIVSSESKQNFSWVLRRLGILDVIIHPTLHCKNTYQMYLSVWEQSQIISVITLENSHFSMPRFLLLLSFTLFNSLSL